MGMQETAIQIPTQLLDQAKKGQDAALVAIRQVVDSVDNAVPDLRPRLLQDRLPERGELIDSAFDVTERALNAGHGMATIVVTTVTTTAGNALNVDAGGDGQTSETGGDSKSSASSAPSKSTATGSKSAGSKSSAKSSAAKK